MHIQILQLLDGAKQATGLTVIIDVFRAFTVAPLVISKGVSRLIPVGDLNEAFELKKRFPDAVLIGERNEQKIPGFDFGNSPSQIWPADLKDKIVIHTTSSGTQGLVNATRADEIITGSFVNAHAIVNYINARKPQTVSLVCMGYACQYPTEEDTFCAEWIRNELLGIENHMEPIESIIRKTSGKRFFDPTKQFFSPEADYHIALQPNQFSFILQAQKNQEGFMELFPVETEKPAAIF